MSPTTVSGEPEVKINPVHLRVTDVPFVEAVASRYVFGPWSKEELISVLNDAMRLVYKIASQYTDPTCSELSQEDLESAGRGKLVMRLDKRVLADYDPRVTGEKGRAGLFKHLKACLNNHIKGFVHRNRYTLKRTGRKVPPKHVVVTDEDSDLIAALDQLSEKVDEKDRLEGLEKERDRVIVTFEGREYLRDRNPVTKRFGRWYYFSEVPYDRSFKPEVSLSDPDASAAVERAASIMDDHLPNEAKDDLKELLTPVEFLVLCQILEPNENALVYATLDMYRGPGKAEQFTLREEHYAAGLGLDLETFKQIHLQLEPKIRHYMSDTATELASTFHAPVAALEKIFGLQIHRSLDPLVLRRMLTVAARAQVEKVNDDVASLLKAVGAQVPKVGGNGNLICYGALHQRNNKVCQQCGVRSACAVETANYGLDEITLSPKLLSARALTRTPYVTDAAPSDEAQVPMTDEVPSDAPLDSQEDELKSYLKEHFKEARFDNQLYYRHKERRGDGKVKYIFWLGRRKRPGKPDGLRIRFCKPSPKLAAYLEKDGSGYYPPDGMATRQVIELLSQHALETF
jgi:hypothetical protein